MGCCQDDDDEVSWNELAIAAVVILLAFLGITAVWSGVL